MTHPLKAAAALGPLDPGAGPILVTNDDGIDARGFRVLEAIAGELGEDVWSVAPADGRSAASAMLSLRKDVSLSARDARRFAVTGAPADCVLAALNLVLGEAAPALVLSGVNHGANLGDDVAFSGTVGAATMAAVHGVPAIALSLAHGPHRFESDAAFALVRARAPGLIRTICRAGFEPGLLYNVNFPHEPPDPDAPAVVCPQGAQGGGSFELRPRGDRDGAFQVWHHGDRGTAGDGSDYAHLRAGRITVTPIRVDRTHDAALQRLAGVLADGGGGG